MLGQEEGTSSCSQGERGCLQREEGEHRHKSLDVRGQAQWEGID